MGNKCKAKGTRAESRVVKYLRDHGLNAERVPLKGSKDEGDIKISFDGYHWIAEVKTGKQTVSPNRSQINEWLNQTKAEMINSGATVGVLIIVRHGRKLIDADVYKIVSVEEFQDYPECHHHWFFEDFVRRIKAKVTS